MRAHVIAGRDDIGNVGVAVAMQFAEADVDIIADAHAAGRGDAGQKRGVRGA